MVPPIRPETPPSDAPECHYAVLGLDHSAGADEIRAAYKRQALLWHPDRHSGSADGDAGTAATERFKRVQEAYEVLSDPAEKRWYDLHREEILSGRRSPGSSEGGWGAGSAWIDVHDLYRWFSPTCYKGFEGPGSFYDVYGKLFAALQEEEIEARAEQREREEFEGRPRGKKGRKGRSKRDDDEHDEVLEFGDASSPYPADLYVRLSVFSTAKDFRGPDPLESLFAFFSIRNPSESARHREKVEFSEAVRRLAASVRRRDPRYKAMVEEKEREKRRKEEERAERLRKEKEEKLAKAKAFKPQAWG